MAVMSDKKAAKLAIGVKIVADYNARLDPSGIDVEIVMILVASETTLRNADAAEVFRGRLDCAARFTWV